MCECGKAGGRSEETKREVLCDERMSLGGSWVAWWWRDGGGVASYQCSDAVRRAASIVEDVVGCVVVLWGVAKEEASLPAGFEPATLRLTATRSTN